MIEIIPAILPKNYEDLKEKISLVKDFVPLVQIDICDRSFVPSFSWPFLFKEGKASFDTNFKNILNEEEGLPYWQELDFELDLMVKDPVLSFDLYTKLGPKRIIFHLESISNKEDFKDFLEGIDFYIRDFIKIGIAINSRTDIEELYPFINNIDFVQLMGIKRIGFQGEKFDESVIDRIKTLREKFTDLIISVDGGVSLENKDSLIEAGANRLVVGSAIFASPFIEETITEFNN